MTFWNKYPYSDFHELNLDWLLNEVAQIENTLDGLHDQLKAELSAELKAYVDQELLSVIEQFNALRNLVNSLSSDFDDLRAEFTRYENEIDGKIANLKTYIDNQIIGVNNRTDLLIASNNDFIFANLAQELRNITVINYFTGEEVSIQDMFNTLAQLHLTDSIAYNQITARGYTYGSIEALNLTYGDIVMHGNTLLP